MCHPAKGWRTGDEHWYPAFMRRRLGCLHFSLGGDNKLSVQIAGNGRNLAECGQPIRATPRSCGYIMDEMRKDSGQEAFGRPGSPQLTVALPLTLRSRTLP